MTKSWSLLGLSLALLACKVEAGPLIRVAVLDTGVDVEDVRLRDSLCQDGHRDFSGRGLQDDVGHGTHIASLINQYANGSDFCLVIIKFFNSEYSGHANLAHELEAIRYAVNLGVQVVNLSGGGTAKSEAECRLVRSNPSVTFVVAAGNDGLDLSIPGNDYYPAKCGPLSNLIVVGAADSIGVRARFSNYGIPGMVWEDGVERWGALPRGRYGTMSGSSQSTAIRTGRIVRELGVKGY